MRAENVRLRAPSAPASSDPARNWTEDFGQENGDYFNRCSQCSQQFQGQKRRVVCKQCASRSATASDEDAAFAETEATRFALSEIIGAIELDKVSELSERHLKVLNDLMTRPQPTPDALPSPTLAEKRARFMNLLLELNHADDETRSDISPTMLALVDEIDALVRLAADAERLDWLETSPYMATPGAVGTALRDQWWVVGCVARDVKWKAPTLRAAIDAARRPTQETPQP